MNERKGDTQVKISEKDVASLLRTLSTTAGKPHFTSAIIPAAGCGSRMGCTEGKTKQMMMLGETPVIVRTLMAFQASQLINEIIVVARREELSAYHGFKEQFGLTKLTRVVVGGETRQESVLRGFEAIDDHSDFVAIHDGARCLIETRDIDKVLNAAFRNGAATAAVKAVDTVKQADSRGFVAQTLPRQDMWLAQTPQIFKTEVYRCAAYVCKEEGFEATDDNALCEHVGFSVKLVECSRENIKITTETDMAIAEAILARRPMPL